MEKRRGRCCWKASCLSRVTILCRSYRSSPCNWAPQPINHLRIGGIATRIAPKSREIVEGLLSTDERIDGEGRGEGL